MRQKLHYFSGMIIASFVAIHLLNHLMLFQGERAHITFMEAARKVYRNPIGETILLTAVVIQVVSGIQLLRRKWNSDKHVFDRMQIYSGLFLSYFLIGHVAAVFAGRYILKLDTNLYFGASVLRNNPALFYYIFHYGLAVTSFFMHIASIHYSKMLRYSFEKSVRRQAYVILGIGIIFSFLIVYRMMEVHIPMAYRYIPFGKY